MLLMLNFSFCDDFKADRSFCLSMYINSFVCNEPTTCLASMAPTVNFMLMCFQNQSFQPFETTHTHTYTVFGCMCKLHMLALLQFLSPNTENKRKAACPIAWEVSQTHTPGKYPMMSLLGYVPCVHAWEMSHVVAPGTYPTCICLVNIPDACPWYYSYCFA